MNPLRRIVATAIGVGGLSAIGCFVYALTDLRSYEWAPLWGLLGLRGVLFVLVVAAGLALVTAVSLRFAVTSTRLPAASRAWVRPAVAAWAFLILWLAEWVFMEQPLTVRLANRFVGGDDVSAAIEAARRRATDDGSLAALMAELPDADPDRLAIMMARVRANRPSAYADVAIGRVIVEHARRYGVSPVLLLHWTYIDSWYGEAPAGRMPFFAEVTGEMFRDLVQAHLPYWFIESPVRVGLIERPWLDKFPGGRLGLKLRYALQKATYDIAIAPYMNSVLSDTLLVLREFRSEFPELFGPGTMQDPLGRAYLRIANNSLLEPYHDPYAHPHRDEAYYDRHRDDLIDFSRAAVYRLSGDFEFATKVQALVARYYADQYEARLGADRWAEVPERQKTALLAMLRDVYVPNVGRTSYNLYMVPEFNTTPIAYIAAEADRNFASVRRADKTWLPPDGKRFWGATGLMLRTLAEVWGAATAAPLPAIVAANTESDAIKVLAREMDR